MSNDITAFVGLDVHKESIAIAVADVGRSAPRFIGTTGPHLTEVLRALQSIGPSQQLLLAYEAGPCGYRLARDLGQAGYRCEVIAVAKMPRRPGDRIKTDRRDALTLAGYLRAGELTPVVIPDRHDEAIRDLSPAREDAVRTRLRARQQLKAMLLRHGHRYVGKTSWNAAHDRWLAKTTFQYPAQDIEFVAAVTVVAEIGDLSRFSHPKQLMSFLGLVPSEYSTGESRILGHITKSGNGHVRRILVESAWTYRFPARLSRELTVRQQGQPAAVRDIAWRAQLRLCSRYRRLQARGIHQNKICIAIARELAGFVWDIARQTPAAL